MTSGEDTDVQELHEVKPREVAGRDVIARFEAQFRAAALASLQILEGKETDLVYCDYQDDYVTRESIGSVRKYNFVQVKTKKSKKHQWSRIELFGLPKKTPKAISDYYAPGGQAVPGTADQLARLKESFAGRLLEHTDKFEDSCKSVTFLTNAFFDDDVEKIVGALETGDVGERTVRFIADNYAATFGSATSPPMGEVHARIRKLVLSEGHDYLDPHHQDFETRTVKAVWKYSEIDLTHTEGIELVQKLLALIQRKSGRQLVSMLTAEAIDAITGVSLDDLLSLLPISKGAYQNFLKVGDGSALKNSSILQRKLGQAGAPPEVIEAASRWKVEWDNWFRTNRHTYERDVMFLQHQLNGIYSRWAKGEVSFQGLSGEVDQLLDSLSAGMKGLLTPELLVGGIMSALVRSESR